MYCKKGHHTVKSIRQRETNFIQAATLCSYVKVPRPNKTQEQLSQNLQGPGFEIKIAACAKNRYQTIRPSGHGDTFS